MTTDFVMPGSDGTISAILDDRWAIVGKISRHSSVVVDLIMRPDL